MQRRSPRILPQSKLWPDVMTYPSRRPPALSGWKLWNWKAARGGGLRKLPPQATLRELRVCARRGPWYLAPSEFELHCEA